MLSYYLVCNLIFIIVNKERGGKDRERGGGSVLDTDEEESDRVDWDNLSD